MAEQDRQQVKEIFDAALRQTPPERLLFLNKVCSDNEALRGEVDSLLALFENAESSTEAPALGALADYASTQKFQPKLDSDATQRFQLKNGQEFEKYQIIDQIGVGGMGEVFLARDVKLKRDVALKLMPATFIPDKERLKRFEVEAFAASSLNHPNIVTVYDVGESGDTHFIATEYVEGETLDKFCARNENSGLIKKLDIAVQIASALSATHEAGIIHRDIKPENIMVRPDGYVKVLDYGVAKLTERLQSIAAGTGTPDGSKSLTDAGTVIGTAFYMSPEQARGKETDGRTDIWSLGVVLYEMLAGEKPFDGGTPTDTIVEIIHKEPRRIGSYVSDLPSELEWIVTKTLSKELDGRYQTAKELHADLEKIKHKIEFENELNRSAAPDRTTDREKNITTDEEKNAFENTTTNQLNIRSIRSTPIRPGALLIFAALLIGSIASGYYLIPNNESPVLTDRDVVLLTDFENKTGEEIFDGTLEQALAMQLQQSPFLSIFPETQVRRTLRFMERSPDERVTREVGREISQRRGLKALIAGTIVKFDRKYSLTLEAVNSQTGETIAITQAEAEGKDQILKSLSAAATEMRKKLGESLALIEKFNKPLEATTKSLEALKAYSLGNDQRNKGNYLEAIPFFKRAVEIDPDLALGYLALSNGYRDTGQIDLAEEAVIKARELRDKVSEREKIIIDNYYYNVVLLDNHKTIELLSTGKQMYPREAWILTNLAWAFNSIGQFEKGRSEALESLQLDLNDWVNCHAVLAFSDLALNRFDEAKTTAGMAYQNTWVNIFYYHEILYQVAFINNDEEVMQKEIDWLNERSMKYLAFSLQAQSAAYRGEWKRSRDLSGRTIDHLLETGIGNTSGIMLFAEQAAVLDQCPQAKLWATKALKFYSNRLVWNVLVGSAQPLAKCGEFSRANELIDELERKYPDATIINGLNIPLIRAEIELQKGNAAEAIKILETTKQYERAAEFHPQYTRGRAYLKLNENEKAKIEFQKILDHRGEAPLSVLYPLAQLGKARTMKDKREYEKFFEMWKDADPDLPILIEAKKEYQQLFS